MKVGAKLEVKFCAPINPDTTTSPKRRLRPPPHSHSTGRGTRSRGLPRGPLRRGLDHRPQRARNETTITAVAVHANSHAGIGRSARPTMPWADADAGSARLPMSVTAQTAIDRLRSATPRDPAVLTS